MLRKAMCGAAERGSVIGKTEEYASTAHDPRKETGGEVKAGMTIAY